MENTILVVDDQKIILDVFEKTFEGSEFFIRKAPDAESALDMVMDESFPVMFLDLKLPQMNGLDLCREIRKTDRTAAIFAMTGHTSIFEHAACIEAGFDDYLKKPLEADMLVKHAREGFTIYRQRTA